MTHDDDVLPSLEEALGALGIKMPEVEVYGGNASTDDDPIGGGAGDEETPAEESEAPSEAPEGEQHPPEYSLSIVKAVEPKDYIEPDWAQYLFHVWDHMKSSYAVLAMGPRGTGKTLAAIVYAARRKRKLLIVNCNSDMTAESLLGSPRIKPSGNGVVDYLQAGPIAIAARLNAVLLLDEFNYIGTAPQANLNPLLDGVQGGIFLPYTGERINWPNPKVIIACNEGYSGTREIQQALKDRCESIAAEYLPEDQEIKLLMKWTRCSLVLAERAVKTANAIRAASKGGNGQVMTIDFDLSPRALRSFAERVVSGKQDENRAWTEAVLNRVGFSLRTAGTREVVKQLSNQIGGFSIA